MKTKSLSIFTLPQVDESLVNNEVEAILFTRVPEAGSTKTRLTPWISSEEAAALQHAMLLDVARQLSSTFAELCVAYAAPSNKALIGSFMDAVRAVCNPSCGVHFIEQPEGSLGERMLGVFEHELPAHPEGCVLMGSDLPELQTFYLQDAVEELSCSDVVLGPTPDGGYWLIGLKALRPELFSLEGYGDSTVLLRTLATAHASNCNVELAYMCSDVDTPEDVARLVREMSLCTTAGLPSLLERAPETARACVELGLFERVGVPAPPL